MARLSIDRTPRVRLKLEMRRVRERHLRAVALGYSKTEAARLAQSNEPINPLIESAVSESSAPVTPTHSEPVVVERKPVKLSGRSSDDAERVVEESKPAAVAFDIPPDWQELPWVELRKLAAKVSGRSITSRKNAIESIQNALLLNS